MTPRIGDLVFDDSRVIKQTGKVILVKTRQIRGKTVVRDCLVSFSRAEQHWIHADQLHWCECCSSHRVLIGREYVRYWT